VSARAALALAVGTSIALHLLAVLLVPAAKVRLVVGGEHLVEVELRPPPPPPLPEATFQPATPTSAPPVTRDELEALARALPAPETPGAGRPLAASPLRLPARSAPLPEPDAIEWPRLVLERPEPLPPRPGLALLRPAAPDPRAATDVARALLAERPSAAAQDAAAQEAMRRLEIEGPVGVDRRVVHEPPLPRVPIRHPASVAIRFYVSPRGDVSRAFPTERGDSELDRAALAYIKAFRFNPLPPGEEKEQWGTIRVRFRLE
jgi:TonB family protein